MNTALVPEARKITSRWEYKQHNILICDSREPQITDQQAVAQIKIPLSGH